LPYADLSDAVEAAVAQLPALGLGEWILDLRDPQDPNDERPTVPIVLPDGSLRAALRAQASGAADALSADGLDRVQSVARLLASLLAADQRASVAYQRAVRAEADSITDSLTGVANVRAWWATLQREAARADRRRATALVAVVDLDGLKRVNDADGHLAGDLLLRATAHAVTNAVRAADFVARLGGDEFGVLAVDYDPPEPEALVARLEERLDAEEIAASIGAALYQPGASIDAVFHEADTAMMRTKQLHRTR
jgi:diguanylate cyclase (GGDEF)-like protein